MKRDNFKLSLLTPDGWSVWIPDGHGRVSIPGKLTREQARYFRDAVREAWHAGRQHKARELLRALREGD